MLVTHDEGLAGRADRRGAHGGWDGAGRGPVVSLVPLSARLAWRELRAGVAGFRIFLACLALGVAAIAAAGSTAAAFRAGLAAQGRAILGGDLSVSVRDAAVHRGRRTAMRARWRRWTTPSR